MLTKSKFVSKYHNTRFTKTLREYRKTFQDIKLLSYISGETIPITGRDPLLSVTNI